MLTSEQQGYASAAIEMSLPNKCIDYFLKNYPCLRDVLDPEEMNSAALFACASAAKTYNPERAGISAYFSRAILHELLKSCQRELRSGSRSHYRISMKALEMRQPAETKPLADPIIEAFQNMSAEDRRWIERHVFEGASIRFLARTEQISSRQAKKKLRCRLDRLRRATADQPHWHDGLDAS